MNCVNTTLPFVSMVLNFQPHPADDISLVALYPTFLQHFMNIAYEYCLKWRYEFNNIKSGIVTYGKSKPPHFANMQERSWTWVVKNCG